MAHPSRAARRHAERTARKAARSRRRMDPAMYISAASRAFDFHSPAHTPFYDEAAPVTRGQLTAAIERVLKEAPPCPTTRP